MAKKPLLLRQRYPGVQWEILTTESSAEQVAQAPLIAKAFAIDGRRLSPCPARVPLATPVMALHTLS